MASRGLVAYRFFFLEEDASTFSLHGMFLWTSIFLSLQ
jgi:hypothetical protein